MSTRQRIERVTLVALAAACGALCLLAAAVLLLGLFPARETAALVCLWVSGVAGLTAFVAACRVVDDSTDDPQYFATIVRGLRAEWQRSKVA